MNAQQQPKFDPRDGTVYRFNQTIQDYEAAPYRYLDTDYLMWPKHVHPLSFPAFKARITAFLERYKQQSGLPFQYRFAETGQGANDRGVVILISLGSSQPRELHCGYLANLYNTETATEGPTGGVYSAVDQAVKGVQQSF
jgi:hypothetical protein